MIGEQMDGFISSLIQKTENNSLTWKPLTLFSKYDSFEREARELIILSENDFFKSILPSSSYFLEYKEGYLVLCNIFMIQNETQMHYNKLILFTKINPYIPLDDSGNFPPFQPKLEHLKLLIEHNIASNYKLPDDLYNFWKNILD